MAKKLLVMFVLIALTFAGSAWAITGDVYHDDAVTLADTITALQVVAGMPDLTVNTADDVYVTSEKVIGLPEAIYALREVSTPVEAGQARAVLGPLAGATVNVYRLNDLETPVYTTTTDAQGFFDTLVTGVNPAEYVLVAVSGGQDTDADDDGVTDATPTPNSGTIHALMTAYQFNKGGFQVTAVSDIAWQYTKNLVGDVDASGLKLRLDDLAKTFFIADLNGDGVTDAGDVLAFLPADATHRNGLNFDFQILFADNTAGYSIIDAYHGNLTDMLPELLEEKFWSRLTLSPSTDVRYDKVKIEVAAFGRGAVTSDMGGIDIDSERADVTDNVSSAFFDQDATGKVTLAATPTSETEILSWQGCDSVSADKSQCEVGLRTDRLISVSFGYKETVLQDGVTLVDLADAQVTVSADQVTLNVTAGAGDTDMIARLAAIKAGDIVVGGAGGGFLRKVVSVQKVSDDNYILTTEDATLEEVIAKGSGVFSKQMTHGDLAEEPTSVTRSRTRPAGFDGVNGVRLLPSDKNDTVFAIEIGNPRERASLSHEDKLKWTDPDTGVIVEAKGTVEVAIDVDIGVSYSLFPPGLEYFKFIPEVSASESLDITVGGEVETPEDAFQKEIGTLYFSPFAFSIGPVPIWVEPQVKIILGFTAKAGGQITSGITLKQVVRAGAIYNRDEGVDMVGEFTPSYELKPTTAQFVARAKPFINIKPVMYFYSVTGPAIDLKGYLKFRGEISNEVFSNDFCSGGISFSAYAGTAAGFEWDLGAAKKLGKWADQVELSTKLFYKEVLLREWNLDGICGSLPPFMDVSGLDMFEKVTENIGGVVSKSYVVKNLGDETMNWKVSFFDDGAISVTPTSGSLAKNQTASVTVSVDTGRLNVGLYSNVLEFINEYDEGLFGAPDGSTERAISVQVTPPPLAAPVLAQPQMATDGSGNVIPSKVNLSWTYPDAATLKNVEGYVVWKSTNPDGVDGWRQVATNVQATSYQVPNLLPNTIYYFAVDAYGTDVETGMSDIVSIKTPTVQSGGDTITDNSGLGMTFVRIPAGTFMMGSPTDEPGRDSNETQHQVTLTNDFYMMTTEVTQAQWEAVMGSNPSKFTACGGDCPVERVSWDDIQDFIAAFNAMEGKTYRLPTEAEWEYAARAGSTTAFYSGGITHTGYSPVDPNLDAIGWYYGNSDVSYTPNSLGQGTHSVAQKQSNAFGLYDMSGNVWEWCQDWYGSYPDGAVTDPTGPDTGSYRVLRGGSWHDGAGGCRSAYRFSLTPSPRLINLGFRVALSPGQ